MPIRMEVGLGPGNFGLDGYAAPPEKKAHLPSVLAHVLWPNGGWIKIPLGTEVNLGPGDVVLGWVAAPPKRGTAPQFSAHVYCGQTAVWIWCEFCYELYACVQKIGSV